MDKIPDKIATRIKIFLDETEKKNIKINSAYLFGSYAHGNPHKWSDIDLAIISDDFSGDYLDDSDIIRDIKIKAGWDFSPQPFKKQEFENSLFARDEIIKKGIKIR